MAGNIGGVLYENKVKTAIRRAERIIPGFYVMRGASGAFDRNSADIYLNVRKQKVAVEVKKDRNAQMGGAAFYTFDSRNGKFYFVSDKGEETVDIPTKEMIEDALAKKARQVAAFLDFIKRYPPTDYHGNIKGLPVTCTMEAWNAARDKGLLKALNTNISFDASFIARHYASKGTNYIQIGGGGLFYLSKNPLDLPIPQLQGDATIEVRVAHHGARPLKGLDIRVVDGTIRAQARLKTKNISPYSLDNHDNVLMLFGK